MLVFGVFRVELFSVEQLEHERCMTTPEAIRTHTQTHTLGHNNLRGPTTGTTAENGNTYFRLVKKRKMDERTNEPAQIQRDYDCISRML